MGRLRFSTRKMEVEHMTERHQMVVEQEAYGERLLSCPLCSRRVVLGGPNGYTSLDKGDFFAQHWWSSTPALSFGATMMKQDH